MSFFLFQPLVYFKRSAGLQQLKALWVNTSWRQLQLEPVQIPPQSLCILQDVVRPVDHLQFRSSPTSPLLRLVMRSICGVGGMDALGLLACEKDLRVQLGEWLHLLPVLLQLGLPCTGQKLLQRHLAEAQMLLLHLLGHFVRVLAKLLADINSGLFAMLNSIENGLSLLHSTIHTTSLSSKVVHGLNQLGPHGCLRLHLFVRVAARLVFAAVLAVLTGQQVHHVLLV
mmetsp:Transcript_39942/g.95308  ORF Transcript_39942/g.95308 Transcript_39942/m.95308 type:complete len:227 (-) Transcript_39942:1172-1852(-)